MFLINLRYIFCLSFARFVKGEVNSTHTHHKELFFRNISQILNDLLKDYDSSQHPNYNLGENFYDQYYYIYIIIINSYCIY